MVAAGNMMLPTVGQGDKGKQSRERESRAGLLLPANI